MGRKKTAKRKSVKKKSKRKPRANGADGRNNKGQFENGNKLGVGNKSHTNEKAKALKKALLEAITEKDIKKIGRKLVSKAKSGDVPATKELFDRLWGRAIQEVDIGENTISSILDIMAIVGIDVSGN